MKKTLLFIAGAMLITTGINAQISLTSGSYPVSVLGTDSLEVTATNPTGLPSFSAATNATWDLSTITDSALAYAYRVSADTSSCSFADSATYSFSTATYQGNVQSTINSTGLIQYGVFIPAATQTIGSGLTSATINILNQHSIFSAPHTVIKFPATMGTTWSSSYTSDFNVLVTASILSLTNSPGAITANNTETDTVIGWGKMRIKNVAGGASLYFDVLQVKTVTTTVNTLTGSLATLASAASIANPNTTNTYAQDYYRTNEVTPFAHVVFTDSTYSTPAKVTTHSQRLQDNAVPAVINNADVHVYPNPVTGHNISIDVPAAAGQWNYELVNVLGQKVAAGTMDQAHTQVQLSNTLTTGMYYIRLINGGKQVAVKALEIN